MIALQANNRIHLMVRKILVRGVKDDQRKTKLTVISFAVVANNTFPTPLYTPMLKLSIMDFSLLEQRVIYLKKINEADRRRY